MFERILVPLDGSPSAEAVFAPLRKVLGRKDAEIVLFQAIALPPAIRLEQAGPLLESLEAEASRYLEALRARLESQGAQARTHIEAGRPAEAILKAIEVLQPSLVAMSTHGRSGLARWMLGSVTEEVLRRSPVPVWVANANPPDIRLIPGTTRTILVPFDGSEESLSVVPQVIETARLLEAGVAVLLVEDGAPGGTDLGFVGLLMDGPASLEGRPDVLDRDLIGAGNRFAAAGLRTTLFRVRGNTAEKINHLARILPADLIVMASHGRRGVSRFISGSVAEEVVRKADAPVLVRRIGSEAEAPAVAG